MKVGTLPDGILANGATAVPEDGKSSKEDEDDADPDEVVDSGGNEDGTSHDINTEINEGNVPVAHMNENDEDGSEWTSRPPRNN
jgi:hypothetical protein